MDASSTYQMSLPLSSDALLVRLRDWDIPFSYHEHVPLKTVRDAKQARGQMLPTGDGGGHIKNLYLRDKKKRNYLVVVQEDRAVDLGGLATRMGAGRLSFGSPERLMEHLGVRPGAVTPLAMVTGVGTGVEIFLDDGLQGATEIYAHPLVNDRTIGLSPTALAAFFDRIGCLHRWLDLTG